MVASAESRRALLIGVARQGYDVVLMAMARPRWRAPFLAVNPAGRAHLVVGFAVGARPAVPIQRAPWQALTKANA